MIHSQDPIVLPVFTAPEKAICSKRTENQASALFAFDHGRPDNLVIFFSYHPSITSMRVQSEHRDQRFFFPEILDQHLMHQFYFLLDQLFSDQTTHGI